MTIDGSGGWLLDALGSDFALLAFADADAGVVAARDASRAASSGTPLRCIVVASTGDTTAVDGATVVRDVDGRVAQRYDATPGHGLPDPARPARLRAVARRRPRPRAGRARSRVLPRRRLRVMGALNVDANLARPDDFYERLIEMHRDLDREQSELVNCKLILLLANHIGDDDVLRDAMARARDGVGSPDAERKESR